MLKFAKTEILQESSQLPYAREASDVQNISTASKPEETSKAPEVVLNVSEASGSFKNDPHRSQLRVFGHKTSFVEKEIDKIFAWQSKRLNVTHRDLQSEFSVHSCSQAISSQRKHAGLLRKVIDNIRNIRKSKYCLLLKLILFAASIATYAMGVKYMNDCPASEMTPFLLTLIGGLGVVLFFIRIVTAFRNQISRPAIKMMEYVSIVLHLCLGIALCIEIISFHNLCPDFKNPASPNHCKKTFYYYMFSMNIVAVVIGFLVFLMNVPRAKDMIEIGYMKMG